ncbi:SDR family oxidoreductase, partial [Acinetobacter baumannii]
ERGANLALAARDGEELKRAKKILGLSDGRVHTFVCDITEQKQVQFTVTAVELACGQIDVLVNNAGLIEVGPMELQTKEDYEVSMNT